MIETIIELIEKPDYLWTVSDYAVWYGYIAVCSVAVILICCGLSWIIAKIIDKRKKK